MNFFVKKMVRLPQDSTCEDVMALTTCDENPKYGDDDDTYEPNPQQDGPLNCR